MSESNGPVCPECGMPRAADGTPACSCGRLASDARRETRTAEAAAAEDFDPVRIRPFVELDDGPGTDRVETPQRARESTAADALPTSPDAAETPPGHASLLEGDTDADEAPAADTEDGPRRRRRALLLTGAGVTVVALLTGAFLGGLFTYDSPSRDEAVSDDIRAPVPDGSAEDGTSPEGRSSGTASASPSPSSTPSPVTTPADRSPTPTAVPTAAPSSAGTTTSAAPEPSDAEGRPPVLRFGDRGPEVVELQLRLRQIGLYGGDARGEYDRTVEGAVRTYQLTRVVVTDESGVYGTATRASLESETSEP
ncbi:peptidoglycan-binding protein [Streptomyces sp. NPDC051243]|uniref:peptidoglycan-binding protein n=1 Tax=Streptomyces sp. NPDC051243 TaxID=3365646 RepID=UPI0037A75FA1